MSRDNPSERCTDTRIGRLAFHPGLTLAARVASTLGAVVLTLLAFIATSSLGSIDKVVISVGDLKLAVTAVGTKVEEHSRRLSEIEGRLWTRFNEDRRDERRPP